MDTPGGPLDGPETLARPGEVRSDNARPELYFQRRRKLLTLFFVLVILFICWFMADRFTHPFSGADVVLTGGSAAVTRTAVARVQGNVSVAGYSVTPTPQALGGGILGMVQPQVQSQVQQGQSVRSSAVPAPEVSAVMCRVTGSFEVSGVRLLRDSLVRAVGFSYAQGGVVQLSEPDVGWVSATFLSCPPEIVRFERPYFVLATPTPTLKRSSEVVRVPVPQTVVVTSTPCTNTKVNGVILDGDCVVFQIEGIRAIYADGKPVVGGSRLCGISSFSITIK